MYGVVDEHVCPIADMQYNLLVTPTLSVAVIVQANFALVAVPDVREGVIVGGV